mmetsp:Transcript_31711/g.52298  ORF Transcript_31711/g.52298 Transcript_31711/m.52298 type:complete len:251 (-) Transcript_31711:130-882(-)
MFRQHGLCPLPLRRTMALSIPSSRSPQWNPLRNMFQTICPSPTLVSSRITSRRRMVGSHAPPRHGRPPSTPFRMAIGSRPRPPSLAPSHGTHYHVSSRGTLLPRSSHVEETRCLAPAVGLQFVSTTGAVEVCPLFAIVLLQSAMSKCVVAYCPQTRVLQTQSILVECRGVRDFNPHCHSRDLERSALVRFGTFLYSTILLYHGRVGRWTGDGSQENGGCRFEGTRLGIGHLSLYHVVAVRIVGHCVGILW